MSRFVDVALLIRLNLLQTVFWATPDQRENSLNSALHDDTKDAGELEEDNGLRACVGVTAEQSVDACRMSIDHPWLKVVINVLTMDGKIWLLNRFQGLQGCFESSKNKAVPE